MERLTSFVSSRGLLKSCTCHNEVPSSSINRIDDKILESFRPGASIYVCTEALVNFAENFFPRINAPFVLVSGDSDQPISDGLFSEPVIQAMLESPHLTRWFAQNLGVQHPKLLHLAIGLDYHTMLARPGFWGMTSISPFSQEHMLVRVLADSTHFSQRYLAAYSNWHFAIDRGDRQQCFDTIDRSVVFFETHQVPRQSTWMRQSECMFVVSPEGGGMDCHRTWEALILGCIPIVKRNALTPLFENLPVLLLDDWSELSRDRLLAFFGAVQNKEFDFSSLFKESWIRQISGQSSRVLPDMSMSEFRKFLTRQTA